MPRKYSKKKVKRVLDTMNASIQMAEKKFGPLHPERDPVLLDPDSIFYEGNKQMTDKDTEEIWQCLSCGEKMSSKKRIEVLPGAFKCYECRGELKNRLTDDTKRVWVCNDCDSESPCRIEADYANTIPRHCPWKDILPIACEWEEVETIKGDSNGK